MIETERLKLRPWRPADLPFVGAILGDHHVMEFSELGTLGVEAQAAWLKGVQAARVSEQLYGTLAIETTKDGYIVGYIKISNGSKRVQEGDAEIGFRLARHAWKKGYATEAANEIMRAARGFTSVKRIVAIVDPKNHRSLHVLRKIGMTYERDIMIKGYDHPDHLYVRSMNP